MLINFLRDNACKARQPLRIADAVGHSANVQRKLPPGDSHSPPPANAKIGRTTATGLFIGPRLWEGDRPLT